MAAELAHAYNDRHGEKQDANVQFLTFAVDQNEYAVDIMKVREIRGWHDTTRIPNSPEYMMGVINLRGTVIPIFDLRNRFSLGKTTPSEKNVVVVLAVADRTLGILVDAVSDILTINRGDIKQAPSASKETGIDDAYVSGLISVSEKMVILLDVEYLFDRSMLDQAENSAAQA
jgi:purine-binding chemotaxis protein CheW